MLYGSKSPVVSGIAVVYLAGFLQGLTLVSLPASSIVLKHMHGLTSSGYGLLFLPQVALAVVGSILGGMLARRAGLRAILLAALLCNAFSQAALAESAYLQTEAAYYLLLLCASLLGLGFGLAAAPLNSYPQALFPARRDTAVVALHTLLAAGLAAGPLLAGRFISSGAWTWFPISLSLFSFLLTGAAALVRFPEFEERDDKAARGRGLISSKAIWQLIAIVVLYALAEGTFSNWAIIYLHESKNLPEAAGALALSLFWASLAAGRLLVSVMAVFMPSARIWRTLPLFMALVFIMLPYADSSLVGVGLFALAGLSCSAFFPLTIRIASKSFPSHVARVSSVITGALMVGIGLGTFATGLLTERLSLEVIYTISALYPLSAFLLVIVFLRRAQGRGQ